jgi:hypothetical protein
VQRIVSSFSCGREVGRWSVELLVWLGVSNTILSCFLCHLYFHAEPSSHRK